MCLSCFVFDCHVYCLFVMCLSLLSFLSFWSLSGFCIFVIDIMFYRFLSFGFVICLSVFRVRRSSTVSASPVATKNSASNRFEKWEKLLILNGQTLLTPPPSPSSDRVKIAFCSILLFETKEQNFLLLFCCLTKNLLVLLTKYGFC